MVASPGTIAITDFEWYTFLCSRPEITELNFWKPSARRGFRALPFSPFLFKLKKPHYAVCGFAYFAQYSSLPDWLAWDSFGEGNGCESLQALRTLIGRIRDRIGYKPTVLDEIGCIQLVQPVFFPPHAWVPQPADWPPPIQGTLAYDLSSGEGLRVWQACLRTAAELVQSVPEFPPTTLISGDSTPRYGVPQLVVPRLGQNTFRIAVLDAYSRACSVTGEHSLPALEAAHIRDYAAQGPHEVSNGLLLRADLHRLFDKGYVTVTPDLRLEVGDRLRREFDNGRSYYPLHGKQLQVPPDRALRPSTEYLRWHNEERYRA